MTPFAEVLAKAFENRDALHAATDQLNRSLTALERALAELRLGVAASVEMAKSKRLAFAKDNDVWRLMVVTAVTDATEEYEPLLNAPRSIRLAAVQLLPALVLAMTESVVEETKRVKQRTDDVERLIERLKGG